MTRASELRELSDDALEQRLIETKDELFKIRFTHATGQLDKYHRIPELRRDVARISTMLREREIAAAERELPERPKGSGSPRRPGNTEAQES
jgi:large subunit ribosomal protein L29